jgi:hypothetical protein
LASKASKKIRFTKHAREKFELLKKYGFEISEATVEKTVAKPHLADRRDDQVLVLKPLDREYAVRVVYKTVNDNIVVLTFYPVKRKRFNV